MISERCLDRYNKLVNNEYGVAGWNGYYDEFGKLVILGMYDQDRKSVDPDSWDPLSMERFQGQIRSIRTDETDKTDPLSDDLLDDLLLEPLDEPLDEMLDEPLAKPTSEEAA